MYLDCVNKPHLTLLDYEFHAAQMVVTGIKSLFWEVKQTKHQTKSRYIYQQTRVTWLKLLGSKFFPSQKMTALSREQTV